MILEAKRSKHSFHYDRHSLYAVNEVIGWIREDSIGHNSGRNRRCFNDDIRISLAGKRYKVFVSSGIACVSCGIEAEYFALERDGGKVKYHMNMYAISRRGGEVLMTRDHIQPLSKGGNDALRNQQTMCIYCNQKKGDNEN